MANITLEDVIVNVKSNVTQSNGKLVIPFSGPSQASSQQPPSPGTAIHVHSFRINILDESMIHGFNSVDQKNYTSPNYVLLP